MTTDMISKMLYLHNITSLHLRQHCSFKYIKDFFLPFPTAKQIETKFWVKAQVCSGPFFFFLFVLQM